MCVIIVAKNKVLKPELFMASERINPDGAGIAWIEEGKVRVEKGLGWEEVYKLHMNVPFPNVTHFRAATSGGRDLLLNHPFVVSEDCELEYSGEYDEVLMHNGHSILADDGLRAILPFMPDSRRHEAWSDSRAMAYLVYKFGKGWLNTRAAGQRVAIINGEGVEMYGRWDLNLTNLALSTNIVSWARGNLLDNEDMKEYDNKKYEKFDWDGFDTCMLKQAQGHGQQTE